MSDIFDIAIVGAGMCAAGLAMVLKEAVLKEAVLKEAASLVVFEKSRGIGGRMATRYNESRRFDHGAQFVTAQSAEFRRVLEGMPDSVKSVWWESEERRMYRGVGGMNALPRYLLSGQRVLTNTLVTRVKAGAGRWAICDQNGHTYQARFLVLTAPLPQSLQLLPSRLVQSQLSEVSEVAYHQCVALLIDSSVASGIAYPGITYNENLGIATLTDNVVKGLCDHSGAALTVHCDRNLSSCLWALDDAEVASQVLDRVASMCALEPTQVHVHRWRYSEPAKVIGGDFCVFRQEGSVGFLAGEVFVGARVEGAFLSGCALGRHLLDSYCWR